MKSSFQTILLVVFILAFVVAVAIFSGLFSSKSTTASTTPTGRVVVWGVLPREGMQQYIDSLNTQDIGYTVTYVEHNPATLSQDITVGLANGTQPDVVIFSSETFSAFKDKLYTIPYTAYPERTYRDTNIDGANIFLTKAGIVGFPLVVDPLVTYYNKDLLAAGNFVTPPDTWNGLIGSLKLFVKKDARNNITQTAVALGTENNVDHMRDILSALFLQTGNQIVSYDATTDARTVVLGSGGSLGAGTTPTADALTFYTNFSNPTGSGYSWNRALPTSLQYFLAGKSTFYIGRASELFTIQKQNPNLNFDVMQLFQPYNAVRPITFGSYIGVAALKSAPNFTAAYNFLGLLSGKDAVDGLSKLLSLPPVRRDLLLVQQDNPYVAIFFRAATSAFAWLDPNPASTETIFRAMITSVTSGKSDATTAIYDTIRDLQNNIQ